MSNQNRSTLPQEGTQIGRYRLGSLLGEGAAGIVYRAQPVPEAADDTKPPVQNDLPGEVALKILRTEVMTHPQVLACFQFEGRVLTRLDHPGILKVYETGMHDGMMFTAMELIAGQSLDAYLAEKKRLDLPTALHIASQTADALDYLHTQGYAHRDIKPANILYDPGGSDQPGRVAIFDFGTAIRVRDGVDYEKGLYGTPAYLAPEQIDTEKKIDGRADLYALGIMLYLMVSGRKPFYGTREQVLRAHLEQTPEKPSKHARVPEVLDVAILKSLAKDPAERYPTGSAFSQALGQIAQDLPPPHPSLMDRLFGWLRSS